jgi:hypothetical protein
MVKNDSILYPIEKLTNANVGLLKTGLASKTKLTKDSAIRKILNVTRDEGSYHHRAFPLCFAELRESPIRSAKSIKTKKKEKKKKRSSLLFSKEKGNF